MAFKRFETVLPAINTNFNSHLTIIYRTARTYMRILAAINKSMDADGTNNTYTEPHQNDVDVRLANRRRTTENIEEYKCARSAAALRRPIKWPRSVSKRHKGQLIRETSVTMKKMWKLLHLDFHLGAFPNCVDVFFFLHIYVCDPCLKLCDNIILVCKVSNR